ncbi:MAG: hypothetical protein K8S97_01810, partial [Anaerolineae bacterium]|nr:hypothetical protein [Anaerolineae bacterium]
SVDLNAAFGDWLDDVLVQYKAFVDEEVYTNRCDVFPALQECLTTRPVDVACLRTRVRQSKYIVTSSLQKYQDSRVGYDRLLEDTSRVQQQIAALIDYPPDAPDAMAHRIDEFVVQGRDSGLQPGQVLMVASLILTLVYPRRFVGFPSRITWVKFANTLSYGVIDKRALPGEKLVWASTFASALAETEAFTRKFRREVDRAMWVISALNWTHKRIIEG